MSRVMTHNANIIKKQIQTAAVKHIMYPQIDNVYVNVRNLYLTWVHCDPAADHFTWYYVKTLHRVFYVSQNVAFEGIPRKAHQVSASNLYKFSIKCTPRTFYLTICIVNDYKHNSYLTIGYLNYDFITNKSLLLEK